MNEIISAAVLLILIMDPLGNLPIFMSVLKHTEPKRRRAIMIRELFIALLVMLIFLFAGEKILAFLNLRAETVSISGGIILFLIVLVGAFGLVSSLVMTVNSKRSDIAILRTQGATRGSIMRIFMVQGAFIGTAGVLIGVGVGLLIASNVDSIVGAIEQLFGVQFLPKEIYFISAMPSDPRASDVIPIAVFSFLLALAATVYPSWRAANIQPAEALRYE